MRFPIFYSVGLLVVVGCPARAQRSGALADTPGHPLPGGTKEVVPVSQCDGHSGPLAEETCLDPEFKSLGGLDSAIKEDVAQLEAQVKGRISPIPGTWDEGYRAAHSINLAREFFARARISELRSRALAARIEGARHQGRKDEAEALDTEVVRLKKNELLWLNAGLKSAALVAHDPNHRGPLMDEVLFYLTWGFLQGGHEELARVPFERLVREYPASRYLVFANLSFGEYYFSRRSFNRGLQFYQKVIQFSQGSCYRFARWREGCVFEAQRENQQALASFAAALGAQPDPDDPVFVAARGGVVGCFARVGDPEKASPFFERVGGTGAATMLVELAGSYEAAGRLADAALIRAQIETLEIPPASK